MSTPFRPLPCPGGSGGEPAFDVEGALVCDVDADGQVVGTALVEATYDAAGVRTGTRLVNVLDGTPYVPVGTVQPCREGCCPEPVVLCDVQPDGSTVQFIRSYTGDEGGSIESADTLLDGSPYAPTGTVGSCDPYTTCTPSSDQNLNGECGPGESPNGVLIQDEPGVATDSVVDDDPTADSLCGGVWDRPSQASPFQVDETFRNAAFDQSGPVTQGTAPYAGLTASPGWTGSNVDPVGDGWLQTSDINSGTNGIWQVPNPFSTADGMTAQVTFASHDGTAQGGDGLAFVFTNGSVPPQASAIGGFGNLGLQNWDGGYIAVVLDEYGQTCTCDHTPNPGSANPGPCGFCTNTISIQLAGSARDGASCACCTIARAPVAPNAINGTTRTAPGRLIVSIIEDGGQTFVSASVVWPGSAEPVVYFDRVRVDDCAGPSPATLRMALYGGSGGSFRSEHEYRDAVATAAGQQQWRAFPITTDPIPACVTSVRVEACVDVTFVQDTQAVGNGNPEAFLWLVNTATSTILDRAQRSSQPSQVGTTNTMCVDTTVPVADLANLRVYVGAETRDASGIYGSTWENFEITVAGLGCPVMPVRTLAISAPCPIDVNIVGGTADGTPAPVTVVNTPSTFEDALICYTIGGTSTTGFRREVRAADGTVTFQFLGVDGVPVTPDSWTPGPCGANGQTLGPVCYTTGFGSTDGFMTLDAGGNPVLYDALGNIVPDGTYTIVICPLVTQQSHILCDQGNDGHQFLRWYVDSPILGQAATQWNFELDGSSPYVPIGPVGICGSADTADREVVCWTQTSTGDEIHTGTIRHDDALPPPGWILFDQHQTPVSPAEPGLTFVPCGQSECCPVVVGEGCWQTTSPAATGRWTSLRMPGGTILLVDQEDGHTVAPADVVTCPPDTAQATLTSQARLLAAGQSWTAADVTGRLTSVTFSVLTGTATVVDANGTASAALPAGLTATWNAEDLDTLTGPQSITAAAASTVFVHWTEA